MRKRKPDPLELHPAIAAYIADIDAVIARRGTLDDALRPFLARWQLCPERVPKRAEWRAPDISRLDYLVRS